MADEQDELCDRCHKDIEDCECPQNGDGWDGFEGD